MNPSSSSTLTSTNSIINSKHPLNMIKSSPETLSILSPQSITSVSRELSYAPKSNKPSKTISPTISTPSSPQKHLPITPTWKKASTPTKNPARYPNKTAILRIKTYSPASYPVNTLNSRPAQPPKCSVQLEATPQNTSVPIKNLPTTSKPPEPQSNPTCNPWRHYTTKSASSSKSPKNIDITTSWTRMVPPCILPATTSPNTEPVLYIARIWTTNLFVKSSRKWTKNKPSMRISPLIEIKRSSQPEVLKIKQNFSRLTQRPKIPL